MTNHKYEYYLKLWGGLFNKDDHDIKEGDLYFDSKKERDDYRNKAKNVADSINRGDAVVMAHSCEGYTVREKPVLHRIAEYEGEIYYSKDVWAFPCADISVLEYHMEYKWYPGFNDYVIEDSVDEKVDYSKVNIIQEWITGAFNYKLNRDE